MSRTVLLVDNDPEWLDLLALDLGCEGHTVVGKMLSGDTALAFMADTEVAVLVVDYRMPPGPNGLEVVRRVRRDHPHVRVVMFSNYDDPTLIRAVESEGASFVLKPAMRTLRAIIG